MTAGALRGNQLRGMSPLHVHVIPSLGYSDQMKPYLFYLWFLNMHRLKNCKMYNHFEIEI